MWHTDSNLITLIPFLKTRIENKNTLMSPDSISSNRGPIRKVQIQLRANHSSTSIVMFHQYFKFPPSIHDLLWTRFVPTKIKMEGRIRKLDIYLMINYELIFLPCWFALEYNKSYWLSMYSYSHLSSQNIIAKYHFIKEASPYLTHTK